VKSICVLAPWELAELVEDGITPECRNHYHVRKDEARQMIGMGDERPYHQPVASYVNERRIVLKQRAEWRKMDSGGFKVMQLIKLGDKRAQSRAERLSS